MIIPVLMGERGVLLAHHEPHDEPHGQWIYRQRGTFSYS